MVAENRPYIIAQSGCNGFFDGYYSPRHDENGEVVGGVAIIRDVTERKLAETATPDDHRRLAFHVENTPLAVIEWDQEFKVLRWSPAAQRLFGWKAEEVLGKRFSDWEFVVPDDIEVVNQVGHRQNQGQEHHGISRNRNYTKLGSILHCEWYNSALYNEARQAGFGAFARARRDGRDAYRRGAAKVRSAVSFAVRIESAADVGLRSRRRFAFWR